MKKENCVGGSKNYLKRIPDSELVIRTVQATIEIDSNLPKDKKIPCGCEPGAELVYSKFPHSVYTLAGEKVEFPEVEGLKCSCCDLVLFDVEMGDHISAQVKKALSENNTDDNLNRPITVNKKDLSKEMRKSRIPLVATKIIGGLFLSIIGSELSTPEEWGLALSGLYLFATGMMDPFIVYNKIDKLEEKNKIKTKEKSDQISETTQ